MSMKIEPGNTNIPKPNPPSIKDKIVEFFGHAYKQIKIAFNIGAGNFPEMEKKQSVKEHLQEKHQVREIVRNETQPSEIEKNPEDPKSKSLERVSSQLNRVKNVTLSDSEPEVAPLAPLPKNKLGDQVWEAGSKLAGERMDWYHKGLENAQKKHDAKVERKHGAEAAEKKPDVEPEKGIEEKNN